MQRRHLLMAAVAAPWSWPVAWAHHGWSSFDQDRPLYLEGKVRHARWRNPHVELDIEVAAGLKVPPDLARRTLPAQSAGVDGAALLAKTTVPRRSDRQWELELAPLTRMEAWKVAEIKPGAEVASVGFAFSEEKGDAVMRVEYLFVGGKAYGLRSSPA